MRLTASEYNEALQVGVCEEIQEAADVLEAKNGEILALDLSDAMDQADFPVKVREAIAEMRTRAKALEEML